MTDDTRTAPGAIWSLVLGILGLMCIGPFGAIPAVICGHMSLSKIKRSAGALTGDGMALAGLIIGYISIGLMVVLLPLYAAIAIPSFVRAREMSRQNACINHLRMIDGAKDQWAIENGKTDSDTVTSENCAPYMKNGWPMCPAGGQYSVTTVGEDPACSIGAGHSL